MSDPTSADQCMNPYCSRQATLTLNVFDRPVGGVCDQCGSGVLRIEPLAVAHTNDELEAIVRDLAKCAVAGAMHVEKLSALRGRAREWVDNHPEAE